MDRTKPLAVRSHEAVALVLDLAREHVGHVRLSYKERGNELEIVLLADSEALASYFEYMVTQA